MREWIPWVLACLGGSALAAAVVFLWQSFRAAFGAANVEGLAAVGASNQRASLLHQKEGLLASLRDLQLERDAAKISEQDFAKLNDELRAQARDVLKALEEDTTPYREQAEKLLSIKVGSLPATTGLRCAKCETINDLDASFCKKCGAQLSSA